MAKKKERLLVTLDPQVMQAVRALARAANLPISGLLRGWIQDSLPVLQAVTTAAIAARQGRPESAIKILDGMAAQQTEQLDFLGGELKAKVKKLGGKKKAR